MDLAAEGLTDQQIAIKLDIRPSTVNSYWVRIRGKLGHVSRTELVAKLMREQVRAEFERGAPRYSIDQYVLECLPEAVTAIDPSGRIAYGNLRMRRLFGLSADGEWPPIETLIPGFRQIVEGTKAGRGVHGVRSLLYGRNTEGRIFRILLVVGRERGLGGELAICVIRDFVDDAEIARHGGTARVVDVQ